MDNSLLEGTNIQKYVYPSESCAKKSEKYIFTHNSSSTGMKRIGLVEYVNTYEKSKYRCIFQMLGKNECDHKWYYNGLLRFLIQFK